MKGIKRLLIMAVVVVCAVALACILVACGDKEKGKENTLEGEVDIVDIPEARGEYVYNGEEQEVDIDSSDKYYIKSGGSGINAGEYICIVSLTHADSKWSDGSVSDKALRWSIKKARYNIDGIKEKFVSREVTADGTEHGIAFPNDLLPKGLHATVTVQDMSSQEGDVYISEYGDSLSKRDSEQKRYKLPGRYKYVARFECENESDEGNYEEIADIEAVLTINWAYIDTAKVVESVPDGKEYVYNGERQYIVRESDITLPEGVQSCTINGDNKGIDAGKYTFSIDFDVKANIALYTRAESVIVEWEIKRKGISEDEWGLFEQEVTYNYDEQEYSVPEIEGYEIKVLDGELRQKNSGEYIIKLHIKNESDNYEYIDKEIIGTLAIHKKMVTIPEYQKEYIINPITGWATVDKYDFAGKDYEFLQELGGEYASQEPGEHQFALGLKDPENTYWSDGTTENKTFEWVAVLADNAENTGK